MKKTNAMRILESHAVPYTAINYEWNAEHIDALSVAACLHLDPNTVFKTIVMKTPTNNIFVCCVPATAMVNLKKAKQVIGQKVEPLPLSLLQHTTGYIRGGCSPIGMKHPFPVFIDETAFLYHFIYISAGIRGCQLCLDPNMFAAVCTVTFCDIASF